MEWSTVSRSGRGFTLLETLVAVSIVTIAIVAPMSLASQSLTASYYARDQFIASQLAQEAIEVIRHIRDTNIIVKNHTDPSRDVFEGMYLNQGEFIVDARDDRTWQNFANCGGSAPAMRTDGTPWAKGTFYAYGPVGVVIDPCADQTAQGWYTTPFTRTVEVVGIEPCTDPTDVLGSTCEVTVTVTVTWREPNFPPRQVEIKENLYRWPAT